MTERKDIDTAIAEMSGRYSVTDLVEQTTDDLARGDELFYASGKSIEIIAEGDANMIRWWRIRSDAAEYEVRRFRNFVDRKSVV